LALKSDGWSGGNNFIDFAENQLIFVPENISFQKI